MFIARWSVDVKFGHKDEFKVSMKKWQNEVGNRIGWEIAQSRVLNGSIGALESRFEMEITVESLAELESRWAQMAEIPYHKQYSKDLEHHIVSGTNRWEVFRVVELT